MIRPLPGALVPLAMRALAWSLCTLVLFLADSPGALAESPESSLRLAPEGKRLLVVALDAVPYQVVAEAVAAGEAEGEPLFDDLWPPVPVISTFPSTTTLAFTGMFESLGLEIPPGYEARFYDRDRDRVRGGGLVSYRKIDFSWRDFFDFKIEGALRKGWGYARPLRFARREIRKGLAAFLESDRPVFFFYLSATDGVAHLKGPEALVEVLRGLDRAIQEARKEEDFYTVLLSDHGVGGGEPLRNVRKEVKKALKKEGFRLRKKIGGDRDLVLVPFGLLSSFVVFVAPGQEARAVEVLGGVPGVALCAAPLGPERWALRGELGAGSLERRERETEHAQVTVGTNGDRDSAFEWRYRVEEGDPLGAPELADRWVEDEVWLSETADGRFPDAPHRIARAFDLVENPASVVCSTAPGFMFGSAFTDWSGRLTVGRLRWTHGALESPDTLGFLATDLPHWKSPEVIRFDDTLEALRPDR